MARTFNKSQVGPGLKASSINEKGKVVEPQIAFQFTDTAKTAMAAEWTTNDLANENADAAQVREKKINQRARKNAEDQLIEEGEIT